MSSDLVGEIVVIKRSGNDGARFPLRSAHCTFGRDPECDIRIQIPQVALEHAKIYCDNGKVWLQNLAKEVPTLVNSRAVDTHEISHNDVFTISQRSFRFEFPERRKSVSRRQSSDTSEAYTASPKTPTGKDLLQISTANKPKSPASLKNDEHKTRSPNGTGLVSPTKTSVATPVQQKENTPEELLSNATTPSILKKASAKRSERKRISFGPTLSPELFDKTMPPSTPLRKGRSPSRRLSEPLRKDTPGKSPSKKRCSLGTALGKMPIVEEDENATGDKDPASNKNTEDETEVKKEQPTAPTPLREEIKKGVSLRQTKKKLDAELQKEIQDGKELKKTKKPAPTPLRAEIKKGVKLRQTKKKLDAKLQIEIKDGKELKKTKKSAPTPLRAEIKKGVQLRATKKRLSVKLQNEIRAGTKLAPLLKKSLKTPIRNQIKSGIKLRKLMKKMSTPLKTEIASGRKCLKTASQSESDNAKQGEIVKNIESSRGEDESMQIEVCPLIKEDLSLQTVVKTPKTSKHVEVVEEHFGLPKLLKTPKEKASQDVFEEEHLGLKRLMKTPKVKEDASAVDDHFGLKRLVKTPKEKSVGDSEVSEHLGLKRLMKTPKNKTGGNVPVDGELGLKMLMGSPIVQPVPVEGPHLDSLYYTTTVEQPVSHSHSKEGKSSTPKNNSSRKKTPLRSIKGSPRTPHAGESLKKSITRLRRNSAAVQEEDEALVSSDLLLNTSLERSVDGKPAESSVPKVTTPSLLKKKASAKRSEKKRISFGPSLSPELFDKTLPPSTPLRRGKSPSRRLSEQMHKATPGSTQKKQRCSLGTALGKMPIMEEEEDGIELKKKHPTAPTPLREEIKKGVSLRQTKKKLDSKLQREIQDGKGLIKTKKSAPTPLKAEIKKGVKLRQTKKKLDAKLQKEINDGKELKKTKKSAPTPLRAEIKKGVQLRATKKRLSVKLQNEIRAGTKLVPLLKKSLKTPIRNQIKSGVKLRRTIKKMSTPLKAEIHARRISSRSTKKVETVKPVTEKATVQDSEVTTTSSGRHLLKAKRRLGTNRAPEPTTGALEIPRRLSAKIERPAKKKICRRTTPKKMVELRDQMVADKYDCSLETEVSAEVTEQPWVASPAIALQSAGTAKETTPKSAGLSADSYLCGRPCEDLSNFSKIPDVCVASSFANADDLPVEEDLGLKELMKTPKAREDSETAENPKEKASQDVMEEEHLEQLMKTPKNKIEGNVSVDGELGLRRLFRSPKEQHVPVESPHLSSLFRESKIKQAEVINNYGLRRLVQSPKHRVAKANKYSIEPGTLPVMFKPEKEVCVPVENMNLQDLFVEKYCEDDSSPAAEFLQQVVPPSLKTAAASQALPARQTRKGKSAKDVLLEKTVELAKKKDEVVSTENSGNQARSTRQRRRGAASKMKESAEVEEIADTLESTAKPSEEPIVSADENADVVVESKPSQTADETEVMTTESNEVQEPIPKRQTRRGTRKGSSANKATKLRQEQPVQMKEDKEIDKDVSGIQKTRQTRRSVASKAKKSPQALKNHLEAIAELPEESNAPINESETAAVIVKEIQQTRQTRRGATSKAAQSANVEDAVSSTEPVAEVSRKTRQTRKRQRAAVSKTEETAEVVEEAKNVAQAAEGQVGSGNGSDDVDMEAKEVPKTQTTRQSRRGRSSKSMQAVKIEETVRNVETNAEVSQEHIVPVSEGVVAQAEANQTKETKPRRQTRRGTVSRSKRSVKVDDNLDNAESLSKMPIEQDNARQGDQTELEAVQVEESLPTRRTRRGGSSKAIVSEEVDSVVAKVSEVKSTRQTRRGKNLKSVEQEVAPSSKRKRAVTVENNVDVETLPMPEPKRSRRGEKTLKAATEPRQGRSLRSTRLTTR
ncbi:proliferation marker protein Ki-67-like [Rhopilema esculentum]|uniref:proliferation marker protein Ki-67-like n=1 Tax=Rhopilema esculentum TaxID=499914 RepID=UPI0031CF2AB4